VDNEIPAGLVNGTNATFTLANAPSPSTSLGLYRNGVLQSVGVDYNINNNIITYLNTAMPQTGDVMAATYRVANASGQSGSQAAGALTGFFPAPSIASGAISDQHIADNAAIQESKLALNYPTHSNANDPSADQKSALAGTSGPPSSTNRFVTDSDARLSNSRQPAGHALLSSAHFDTNPGAVSRGDLIIGAGTTPTLWTRLSLGAANRCLTSNGFDVVWNACLFTGYPAGSVPFVDSTGNIAHNQSRLYWDNSNRRLGVGNSTPSATLSVHDNSTGTGVTSLYVRAGDGQSNTPLQRWQDASGNDLARMESNGSLLATNIRVSSTSSQPAWQETGVAGDPSAAGNGAQWLNTTTAAHKTREAGQMHTQPQIICSINGAATSLITAQSLGTCQITGGNDRSGRPF